MERTNFSSTHLEGEITAIVTVGIDLAKNVFAVHGVDESGLTIKHVRLKRPALCELVARLPPCITGVKLPLLFS
jgi:transposase